MIGYILAIGAAATWSLVALSATRIARYFGSYNYTLRLVGIVVLFLPYIVVNWDPIYFNKSIFIAIFLSSVIGIIIEHIFIYLPKNIGPRRQALLFSLQIPLLSF